MKPFDLNIADIAKFPEIAYYGNIWLVQFKDWTRVMVIEDCHDSPEANWVFEELPW